MHVPQTEIILCHAGAELVHVILPPGEYIIGRAPESEIFVETPLLSRQHARLILSKDQLLIEDLGSSNGTFVNEIPVNQPTRLFPNQGIRLGPDIILEVRRQRTLTAPDALQPFQAAIRRHLPEELLAGKRYAIGGIVAQGGMGAILDARQGAMKRRVAMKVMLDTADETNVLRFIDEAQITGQLEHPNIVPIYELGVDEQDQVFYTMKFVRGITFTEILGLLAQGNEATVKKYSLPALLTIFQKVCDALAFAHSKGVIHRDLKPENIMLGDFGSVLVMDWGLAKLIGSSDGPAVHQVASARAAEPDFGSTMTGSIMGTPQYMSPEQARGEIEMLDARSDIYALGAILFHILVLRPPYSGNTAMEVVGKVGRGEVEWPTARELRTLPASLHAICRKALALNPAARYPRVEDLQADLLAYQNGFATSAENAGLGKQLVLALKRHKIAAAGIAAVLLVGSVLGTKALVEGKRAEREAANAKLTLAELRETAPTFHTQAAALLEEGKHDDALQKISYALRLAPDEPDHLLLRARALQSQLRMPEAIAAFSAALASARDPADVASARANLALCERLRAANPGDGPLKKESVRELHAALLAQRRNGEALTLAKHGIGRDDLFKGYQAKIIAAYGEKARPALTMLDDDTLEFKSAHFGLDLADLRTLQGMPISKLQLAGQQVSDLAPLTGMPLRELAIGKSKVRDLSPLRGAPLKTLYAYVSEISDLSPLAGMPLEDLELLGDPNVSDITPLRGMRLRKLALATPKATDFTPLRGMPLEFFQAPASFHDLRVLSGMPLKTLILDGTQVLDLSPLTGMPLETLLLYGTPVEDLTPLRGTPLKILSLAAARNISDFSTLSSLPLEDVAFDRTAIRDLNVLRGLRLKKLSIYNTAITDLAPLRGMPLESLNMPETAITDISPLLDCPTLKDIILPEKARNIEILRQLPNLKRLSFRNHNLSPAQTTAEFWAEYDAQQAAGKQ